MSASPPVKKKKILVFLNSFWNNGAGMSGGDQMLIQVFKRIRKDIGTLWCVTNPDGKAEIVKEVPDVTFKTSPSGFDRFNLMVNYIFRTFFALRCLTLKPDVIYSGSDFFPDVIPAFLFKLMRPRVRWIQCVFHIYPNWLSRPGSKVRSFIAQYMQQFSLLLVRKADAVLNINQGVKNHLIEKGFPKERIVINPPGIDLDYLRNVPSAPEEDGYDGIFLGRLNPSKGIFDLVEIWVHVVKEIPSARLAIMGGGDTEIVAQLKKAIKANRLEENISLLGYLESDKAFGLIKASKVFLFPSHEEGFGIAIVEALACGLPVVAWDLPVFHEFFDKMIYLYEKGNFGDFSERLIQKISEVNSLTEKQVAPSDLEKFSWEQVSKNSFKLFY